YNLTQERLSERIGKKRTTIANFLRLLRLPAEVQLGLRDRKVDMGHARALLSVENPTHQLKLYERIIKEGLSVRKVEELAKKMGEEEPKQKKQSEPTHDFDILQEHLSSKFSTPVSFNCDRSGKGKITFSFKNESELERLITIFDGINQSNTNS
ncbi:MAG: chromosome partitioning protein ParB, partial [Paramuribaculum sp.]|nr:chromosome partitioning protein ParB [Paramuribaculum sp.]